MRGFTAIVLCLFGLFSVVSALYSKTGPVEMLTAADFDKKVINSKESWVIEFFAPWCGHCKAFAPEYEKAARAMGGIVRFGAVEDESLMGRFQVQGFPTVKFFGADNKNAPKEYQGGRTADALVSYATQELRSIAMGRLGKKPTKPTSSSSGSKGNSAIVDLTDSNFDQLVGQDKERVWMVAFIAPWCGHCKNLKPEYEEMARKLADNPAVKIGMVDATKETQLASRYNVRGYPTIKFFPVGAKNPSTARDYNGARQAQALEQFILEHAPSMPVEIPQLVNDAAFKENCSSRVCVLAFLPRLTDSDVPTRLKYIDDFGKAARQAGSLPIKYFWLQGGDNYDFEEQLGLQFGWPAVIGIHLSKGYAVHRGQFSQEALTRFIIGMGSGRVSVSPVPRVVKPLEDRKPWDKDAKPAAKPAQPKDEL